MYVEGPTSILFDGEGIPCHQPSACTSPRHHAKRLSDTVGKAGPKLRFGRPTRLMPSLSLRLETDRFTVGGNRAGSPSVEAVMTALKDDMPSHESRPTIHIPGTTSHTIAPRAGRHSREGALRYLKAG